MSQLFVFSSVGSPDYAAYKKTVFDSWSVRSYASGCVIYNDEDKFPYHRHFQRVLKNKHFKFPNFFYFNAQYNVLDEYDYFAILDDDLQFFDRDSFQKIVTVMQQHDLALCSPTNSSPDCFHQIMGPWRPADQLWFSNFVEIGCMFIRADLLKLIVTQYHCGHYRLVDNGMDYFICQLALGHNFKAGIIKNIQFFNPLRPLRENGSAEWELDRDRVPEITPQILAAVPLNLPA
jgi:hypothetical protein